MEIELKLLLAPKHVTSFRHHPLLRQHAVAKPIARQLTSVYFDTPDCRLQRHEIALRVRRVNGNWIQTLKGGGNVLAGLHQRQEWESRVKEAHPDLAVLMDLVGPDKYWRDILSSASLNTLIAPIFTTKFRRTTWLLNLAHETQVELALDQGEVQHGTARVAISEVELELISGDPTELFEFALRLQDTVPLRLGNISKAEHGYALISPHAPIVEKTERIRYATDANIEQGFLAIADNCLQQIQGNENGVMHGKDPESVHQMRVGVRRLRSALALFSTVVPCPDAILKELEWLAGELGATRDWEVLVGTTLMRIMEACPDQTDITQLHHAARKQAEQSRKQTARAVASTRYAHLLLTIGAWLQGKRWRELPALTEYQSLHSPLADFATQILVACNHKLKKRGKLMCANPMPHDCHRVRIAAKEMRYAAEFFLSLFSSRRIQPYINTLTILQDDLGSLNDITVADQMLHQLAGTQSKLVRGASFARGYLAACSEHDTRKLGKVWKKLKSVEFTGKI